MRIVETFAVVINETHADVSYHLPMMVLWTYAELTLGMIVACSLSLPQFVQNTKWKLPSIFSEPPKSSSSTWKIRQESSKESGKIKVVKLGQTLSQTSLTRTSESEVYQLAALPTRERAERL
jgi:hypothetical protein